MKKSLIMVLCIVSLFSAAINPVFAHGISGEVYDNYVTQKDLDADREEFEALMETGQNIKKSGMAPRVAIGFNLSYLSQADDEWDDELFPCGHSGHTYEAIGCAMTSYAMCFRFLSSSYEDETPVTVAETYGSGACNFSYSTLLSHYPPIKGTAGTISNWTSLENTVIGAINNGRPVVLRLKKGTNTHFVVANGYYTSPPDSTNYFLECTDPDPRLDFETLNDAYDDGWVVNHAVVLRKN